MQNISYIIVKHLKHFTMLESIAKCTLSLPQDFQNVFRSADLICSALVRQMSLVHAATERVVVVRCDDLPFIIIRFASDPVPTLPIEILFCECVRSLVSPRMTG